MLKTISCIVLASVCVLWVASCTSQGQWPSTHSYYGAARLAPVAMVGSADGKALYVGCVGTRTVAFYDLATGKVTKSVSVDADPTGMCLSSDGKTLYVTCASPAGCVCAIDTASGRVTKTIEAGWGACGPVVQKDGSKAYVCNQFNNDVSVIDLAKGKEVARVAVVREPLAADLSSDGKLLFVANQLPAGRADADVVAACVSVIDTGTNAVVATVPLPNGSTSVKDIRVSPDGKLAAVSHVLARYTVPTTQLERGWMNTNAMSLISVGEKKLINTVLLDDVDSGAANPWAVQWTADSKTVCVTHAGTHELSIVNVPGVLEKIGKVAPAEVVNVPNDLSFLVDLRRRVKLGGNGPRALAVVGNVAYTAEYFTDSISAIDLEKGTCKPVNFAPRPNLSVKEKGEMFFFDAGLCFQTWQSCGTCHPQTRVDGLNWDLLNDGLGNPKNTKDMLLSHQTPPTSWMAAREDAMHSVRAGIKFIQFAVRPEEDAVAIDEYLKALTPTPSPYLVNGKLSAAAERGKIVFNDPKVGCANCHLPGNGLFTDMKPYAVGSNGQYDKDSDVFDTPTLIEIWRTAPYLHDGSAATMKDVLTTKNKLQRHGKTEQLSPQQIDDLVEYLLSL